MSTKGGSEEHVQVREEVSEMQVEEKIKVDIGKVKTRPDPCIPSRNPIRHDSVGEAAVDPSGPRCATCGKVSLDTTPLLRCSRCQAAYYCSKICQKTDWRLHKPSCAPPSAPPSPHPSSTTFEIPASPIDHHQSTPPSPHSTYDIASSPIDTNPSTPGEFYLTQPPSHTGKTIDSHSLDNLAAHQFHSNSIIE